MANSVLDMLIRGMPNGGPGLDPRFQTPGINPNAPDIRQRGIQGNPGIGSKINKGFGKLDSFLGSDGGSFLMNLLAQSGYSTVPGSPLGAIGRAGLMTSQQKAAQQQQSLNEQLIRSQIGLNNAKANAGPAGSGPLTEIAKLQEDLRNNRISQEIFDAKSSEILNKAVNERFENTQKLRGEYSAETKDIAKSMQSLSAAESLIRQGDTPNSVAQLAAFISTIKSIDNSTVREGELRAFESVQGFIRTLENQISKAKGKGFTVDLQRDIADTITRLQGPLKELLSAKQDFFAKEAEKFKLDPESITGSPTASVSSVPVPTGPTLAPPIRPQVPEGESEGEF